MPSSLTDRMNSWSVTLGLSGGIEGMMERGVKTNFAKARGATEKRIRHTAARVVDTYWSSIIDVPSLPLTDEPVDALKSVTEYAPGRRHPGCGFV